MPTPRASAELQSHEKLLHLCSIPGRELPVNVDVSGVDWPKLVSVAVRHGVAQQVGGRLLSGDVVAAIPTDIVDCLHRVRRSNAERNAVIFREISTLLRAFEAAGIRVLVLKGVALAVSIYADPAERNFADVDVLIQDGRFDDAIRVASECGYVAEEEDFGPNLKEITFVRPVEDDILTETMVPEYDLEINPEILAKYGRQVKVEIHRTLARFMTGEIDELDMSDFWTGSTRLALPDGTPFLAPSREAMLVHLCQHAAYHNFRRLIFPYDIALAIDAYGDAVDWARVDQIAARAGEQGNVWRMLDLVRREFDASVPSEAMTLFERHGVRVRPLALADIFGRPDLEHAELLMSRVARLRGRELLRVTGRAVFPPPAYLRQVYGNPSSAALARIYLARPFHLAGRALQIAGRRLLGWGR